MNAGDAVSLDHSPALEQDDAIGDREQLRRVRGEGDHRPPRELAEKLGDERDPGPIEVRVGLVEEKEARVAAEQACERDALAFAYRQRIDAHLERVPSPTPKNRQEADAVERLEDPLVAHGRQRPAQRAAHVGAGRQVGTLRQKRDAGAPGVRVELVESDASDEHGPGHRRRKSQEEPQARALARSVRAGQGQDVTPVPGEIELGERRPRRLRAFVPERHALEGDRRRQGRGRPHAGGPGTSPPR